MSENNDYSMLLLRLLAHDLLAPLTAVKWQTELLAKEKKNEKRERYLKGIAESTELGISLAKHAHVASKVLSHTYENGPTEELELADVIRESSEELMLQYGRHALTLEAHIDEEGKKRSLDRELCMLLVWSVGKFFLSCAPPHTLVKMYGSRNEEGVYILRVFADGIPDRDTYLELFRGGEPADKLDQAFVFSKLIREVSEKTLATVIPEVSGETLTLSVAFAL